MQTWGLLGVGGYSRRVVYDSAVYDRMQQNHVNEEHLDSAIHKVGNAFKALGERTGLVSHKELFDVKGNILDGSSWMTPDHRLGIDKHVYRWGTSEYQDSWTLMYKAISYKKDRSPGQCRDRSREGGLPLSDLGETNERIHPSIFWRKETLKNEASDKQYNPPALKNFIRVNDSKLGPGWRKPATSTEKEVFIKEWFIKPAEEPSKDEDLWKTAEWELTNFVDDKDKVQTFLRGLREQAARVGIN